MPMQTEKIMRCRKCGCESKQVTNHQGSTWSLGHFNCCPQCPPYEKYPEFGGRTIWDYVRESQTETSATDVLVA